VRRRQPARVPAPDDARALEIAVAFLGARPRTRWELERRLRRAATSDEVVERTIARLADLGYLDDEAFARWWGEQRDRHAPRGRRMIEAELRQHGVPREVVEAYRAEHAAPERAPEDEGLPSDERSRAREALARHLRGRPVPVDPKAVARVGSFLLRRGFDPETARAVLRESAAAAAANPTDELTLSDE
jgi:regulatory protein